VPRNFYQGLVVLTGMSNWGNLRQYSPPHHTVSVSKYMHAATAVVLTVTQQPPFNPNTDPACEPISAFLSPSLTDATLVGVSFVSIFILSFHLVFWVLGAAHSLSWDYLPDVPQGEAAERRVSWKEKPIGGWISRVLLGHTPVVSDVGPSSETEKAKETTSSDLGRARESGINLSDRHVDNDMPQAEPDAQLTTHISGLSATSFRSRQTTVSAVPSLRAQGTTSSPYLPAELAPPSTHPPPESSTAQSTSHGLHESESQIPRLLPPFLSRIFRSLSKAVTPITMALSVSLVVALIKPLKALFVDTTQAGGPNWKGPDGRPPLSFVIDTGECLPDSETPNKTIPPSCSHTCRSYYGAYGSGCSRRELCASDHSTPSLTPCDSSHALSGIGQNVLTACDRHLHGSGHGE
jgi:auxin efflux carrier family protein